MPRSMEDLFTQWFGMAGNARARAQWMAILYATLWSIWLGRNKLVFEHKDVDWEKLFDLILLRSLTWLRAKHPSFPFTLSDLLQCADSLKQWDGSPVRLTFV
ncbi:hypothetical protein Tsubulata_011552 [Turnera subulata]|uniref:Uncharacterized protein n=1 Tax=Turnera subulata TaxID=218843 RepID=A0A9Q0G0K3_9ROSI|nr:hypothetical protein Tsubulata_011552 [Turnera subulata]